MKPLLFSILILFGSGTSAVGQQRECKDCIEWTEGRKLKWSDFKGRPNKLSRNEALTDSGMSIGLICNDQTSEVTIKCFFDRSKSWTKDRQSEYLLAHEQLHFDITELFVRKLRKELSKFNGDCKRLNAHIQDYYNRNYKEFVAYQNQYDRESEHSLDKEKQAYWEQKVAKELDELKPYASLANN